jgi:AraC-like DNA-binding protein
MRAARLTAIKHDLALNPSLTLGSVAARQGISPRHVQRLFDTDGTTFTAYALALRLLHAHRMLTDPGFAAWTIGAVAYESGFGDLSHFNRSFRRRYGASPSHVRGEAIRSARANRDDA